MQGEIDRGKMTQDFLAATKYLHKHEDCTGKVGVVGFCFGGRVSNTLAVMIPDVITAAVPSYGRQPAVGDTPKIKASLLLQYAGWMGVSIAVGPIMKPGSKKPAWIIRPIWPISMRASITASTTIQHRDTMKQ